MKKLKISRFAAQRTEIQEKEDFGKLIKDAFRDDESLLKALRGL